MPTIRDIQVALNEQGAKPKLDTDGELGRNTINAIIAFQKKAELDIKFPGTIGPKTIEALGLEGPLVAEGIHEDGTVASPPWLLEARRKLGLHEERDNKTLRQYLASGGGALGDPAVFPWCGDFIETVIAKTLPKEVLPSNPYWALSWSKFGKGLTTPKLGAIVTFKRKGGGHVGLIVGHDDTHFHVLGGNQQNGITITRIAKDRMDAMRWPSTYPVPTGTLAKSTINATISTNER